MSGNQIHDRAPPQRAASRRFTHTAQSRRAVERKVEPGEGMEGPGPCGDNETGAHQGRADETAGT